MNKNLQLTIGVVCLVVGVMLLVWGYNISRSVGSQIKEVFTGSPTDRVIYYYIGGAVLSIFGVFQIFVARK
jgi:uncharacterized membrane protein